MNGRIPSIGERLGLFVIVTPIWATFLTCLAWLAFSAILSAGALEWRNAIDLPLGRSLLAAAWFLCAARTMVQLSDYLRKRGEEGWN